MKLHIFGGELSSQNMVRVKGDGVLKCEEDTWVWPMEKH